MTWRDGPTQPDQSGLRCGTLTAMKARPLPWLAVAACTTLLAGCGDSGDQAVTTVTETQTADAQQSASAPPDSTPPETTEPAMGTITRVVIELDDDDLGEQIGPDRFRLEADDDDDDYDERGIPAGPALGLEVDWDSFDDRGKVIRPDCDVTVTVSGPGYDETRSSTDCSEDDLIPELPWITATGDYLVTVSVTGPDGAEPAVAEQAFTVEG